MDRKVAFAGSPSWQTETTVEDRRSRAGAPGTSRAEKLMVVRVTESTVAAPSKEEGINALSMSRAMVVLPPGNICTPSPEPSSQGWSKSAAYWQKAESASGPRPEPPPSTGERKVRIVSRESP